MDYTALTKDELVELLKRRDSQTPLGIVWERNEIDHGYGNPQRPGH